MRGLLSRIDTNGSTYQYAYDALTRLATLTRSGATDSTLAYDAANQLTQIDHGAAQRDHQYQYDPASRISQWQGVAGETRDYDYDDASRLTNVQSLSNPESFTYDALGNRQNDNAQFDAANRITEDNNFTYTYDINGNRTEKVNKAKGEVERYSYNRLDQLIRYRTYPDSNPATSATVDYTYAYGPLGRRWSKQNTLAGDTVDFYWYGSNLIVENNGGTVRRYLLEGVTPTGFVENDETYHYLKDHLSTTHEIVDENGNTVWQGNYDSFGEVTETINLVDNNLRFAGQYQDRESNLYYNYYRDYDPALGRYLQSDPIGLAGGINTYVYALNNPIRYIDPTGEAVPVIALVIVGAVSGGASGYFGSRIAGGDAQTNVISGAAGTFIGAITGGLGPLVSGITGRAAPVLGSRFASALTGGASGVTGNISGQVLTAGLTDQPLNQCFSPSSVIASGVLGAVTGGYSPVLGTTSNAFGQTGVNALLDQAGSTFLTSPGRVDP